MDLAHNVPINPKRHAEFGKCQCLGQSGISVFEGNRDVPTVYHPLIAYLGPQKNFNEVDVVTCCNLVAKVVGDCSSGGEEWGPRWNWNGCCQGPPRGELGNILLELGRCGGGDGRGRRCGDSIGRWSSNTGRNAGGGSRRDTCGRGSGKSYERAQPFLS